ncbi:MAG: hypothetical protein JSV88_33250 [Candidatus Aminicenantes bacterium]|nr:MAG: hypothetical protein JSV88_33250 [Candidatus Aminicenantes bacterium]
MGRWEVKKMKKITMRLSKKKAGAKIQITNKFQITMSKITKPMVSMHPCNIIPTHLFFLSSYLLSFSASLFTPWPPEVRIKWRNLTGESF